MHLSDNFSEVERGGTGGWARSRVLRFFAWGFYKKWSEKEIRKVPLQRPPDPMFFGSSQSGLAGDLICSVRVTHCTHQGTFTAHCGGLSSIVPAGRPFKCLLTCWAMEEGSPRFPN